ncbi:CLU1 [Candida theae]|uniref:Clustered mitochondria protein homolog n=1 Tax=Candida theae TaxID=1198502 RepID=A0AAD5BCD6_9ASCO|nr:CLU1 [Candida theae]KAI5954816.1 CLU1 [Candida theae]
MSDEEKAPELQEAQVQPPKELLLKLELPSVMKTDDRELSIPSHYEENIADLRQSLALLPQTRNLTNYSILVHGVDVESLGEIVSFAEIVSALDLGDVEQLQLQVKAKAYNLASVYEQVSKFRDTIGLGFIDRISGDIGCQGGVSRFNGIDLEELKVKEQSQDKNTETLESKEPTPLSKEDEEKLGTVVDSFSVEKAAGGEITSQAKFDKVGEVVKLPIRSLSVSQWSPVPAFQAAKGDLLYLTLQTLENETFNITCHFSGFFVNKSSTINFNPSIKINEKGKFFKNYVLFDLVSSLSPLFTSTIAENEVKLAQATEYPESYLAPSNSFLAHPWVVDEGVLKPTPDVSRSQLPLINNGVDGSEYIKEWNNEFQSIKELPTSTFQERIVRDKLLQKTLFDFTKTATDTAVHIIKGDIAPMNPTEEEDKYIYLKNGVFYSTGASTVDGFENTGAEEASRYVASKDLAGVKIMNRHDIKGLSTLLTCVVDYMGKRVVCQAPVPGILDATVGEIEGEIQEKVKYGASSDGTKILEDESFVEPLKQVGELFHLKPHNVKISNEVLSQKELVVSKDTKGLTGTDGRKYVIELYRTAPRDIEFIESNFNPQDSKSSYPHGEALVRHEAVSEWWRRKVSVLFKAETEKLEKEGKLESKEGGDKDAKPQIGLPTDQVVFNPDAFSSSFESDEDRDEVRQISKFVKEKLITEFLEGVRQSLPPFDGKQLTEQLHRYGINMRYLGYIAEQLIAKREAYQQEIEKIVAENIELTKKAKEEEEQKRKEEEQKKEEEEDQDKTIKDEKDNDDEEEPASKATYELAIANYNTVYTIAIHEMVARASKHILRKLIKSIPTYLVPSAVAHFHNCLLGGAVTEQPKVDLDESYAAFYSPDELSFTKLGHREVVDLVAVEVYTRFRYQLSGDWINTLVRKPQLLREIAFQFGIQWKSHNYAFGKEEFDAAYDQIQVEAVEKRQTSSFASSSSSSSSSSKKSKKKNSPHSQPVTKSVKRETTFIADDIISFTPVVKDSSYKSSIIDEIFASARAQLVSGDKEVGMSMFTELAAIHESIYGKVNPETARFYTLLAQVYQELGMYYDAALIGRRAVVLCERSCGFDSHDTITAYMNQAFYEGGNDLAINSLKLYKQTIDTWSLVYGADHPAIVNTFINSADVLSKIKQFESAKKLLLQALKYSQELNGEESEITALLYFRIGNVLVSANKISQSKEYFDAAYKIFANLLGPNDSMTKQCGKYQSNIALYVEYTKAQAAREKKSTATNSTHSKKSLQQQSKVKFPSVGGGPAGVNGKHVNGKSNGHSKKGQTPPQPDPSIANQSVDEILNFIEGRKKASSKKSKK